MTEILKAFKPGDVVTLKSGGFTMTVCCCESNGSVVCYWHSRHGSPEEESYHPAVLDLHKSVDEDEDDEDEDDEDEDDKDGADS